MTPDRTEHTPDEPENGVLSETGSIDTTGLGILGGATAQVNVELPTESDDDLDDDGVIDGEVPFVIEIPADADLPVIEPVVFEPAAVTTEAEIVGDDEDLEEWTVEGEGSAPAPLTEDIADAEVLPDVEGSSDVAVEAVEFEPAPGVDGVAHADGGQPDDGESFEGESFAGESFADAALSGAMEDAPDAAADTADDPDADAAPPVEEAAAEAAADEAIGTSEAAEPEPEPEPEARVEEQPAAVTESSGDIGDAAAADFLAADAPAEGDGELADFDVAEFDVAEFDEADFDGEFDPAAEFDIALAEDDAAALAENSAAGDDVFAPADTPEEPMSPKTPSDDGTAAASAPDAGAAAQSEPKTAPASAATAAAATAAAATTASGSIPTTRREAQQTGANPVVARPAERPVERPAERSVERAFPRADVALTSKRLGEFEPDRETADLLTADRLLDPHQVVRPEPEGAWQHFVYSISGKRINLGDSKRAKARKDLDRRIAAPLAGGARFVPVLSRKGGVGKTTVTTLLGQALADARDDRVIAVDANPDRGTLAERISRDSGKTVRDLVRISPEVVGFNDLSSIVARDETRLDVVASDADPRVSEAFNDADYRDVAALAAHYYSIVLTDTGTGIVHSVMGATLDLADQLVIVAGLSVDEARLASETLTWLETNGYSDKVRNAVVVLNNARPGHPLVQLDELESHFRTRVRAVVRVPYDPHIAAGSAIVFRELQPATRDAARQLAATVVEGLRSLASAA